MLVLGLLTGDRAGFLFAVWPLEDRVRVVLGKGIWAPRRGFVSLICACVEMAVYLLIRIPKDFSHDGCAGSSADFFVHPLSDRRSILGQLGRYSSSEANITGRSEPRRPFTFKLMRGQMSICRTESLPVRLHHVEFPRFNQ